MTQLEQVVRLVEQVLGADRVGIYLHGSSVLGGLRPASDLDLLVVSRRSLDEGQRRGLVDGLLPISGPRNGGRHVELTVVLHTSVKPWRYPPTADFRYGDWLREEFEAGALPRPGPMTNLPLEIAVALAGDRTLAGPPPSQVFDPVPPGDLLRGSLDGIPGLLEDLVGGDTRNVLLTLARIWATLCTGTVMTKDGAADWALARLAPEHRPALEHARDLYRTTTYADEPPWRDELLASIRPLVDEMLERIRGLAPEDQPTAG